jgi:hypothetical protein
MKVVHLALLRGYPFIPIKYIINRPVCRNPSMLQMMTHSQMYQHSTSDTTQNVSVAQSPLPARLGDPPDCDSANEVENCNETLPPIQPTTTATSCKTKGNTTAEQRIRIHFLLYGLHVIGHRATMVIKPRLAPAAIPT